MDDGIPKVKYLSFGSAKFADAAGIHDSIIQGFNRFGITSFEEKLVGLNVDGACVNTGKHKGPSARIKGSAPWLFSSLIRIINKRCS